MSTRFDIVSPRARNNSDKPFWHRVGTAFEGEKGLTLVFDSLPLPDAEGRCTVKLFEQREREQSARNDRQQAQSRARGWTDDGDSVPF